MSEPRQLLSAFFAKALEDNLIDLMITSDIVEGFTLSDIRGYSKSHANYDKAEQLRGNRNLVRLEVAHDLKFTEQLLASLKTLHASEPIKYWITPINNEGYL